MPVIFSTPRSLNAFSQNPGPHPTSTTERTGAISSTRRVTIEAESKISAFSSSNRCWVRLLRYGPRCSSNNRVLIRLPSFICLPPPSPDYQQDTTPVYRPGAPPYLSGRVLLYGTVFLFFHGGDHRHAIRTQCQGRVSARFGRPHCRLTQQAAGRFLESAAGGLCRARRGRDPDRARRKTCGVPEGRCGNPAKGIPRQGYHTRRDDG